MDLIKIGKFIAKKRKAKNLTQSQLAGLLYVTDRAVSKWECGRSLPDSSIMLELCVLLGISVNELLTGEELEMETYNKQAEMNLLEAVKQKEEADKRLLKIEIVVGVIAFIVFLVFCITGALGYKYWGLPLWAMIVTLSSSGVMFFGVTIVALRIEQKAGYYECPECHFRYVPTYLRVFIAPHIGRSRLMRCPSCGKISYQKKVISENQDKNID